MKAAVAFAFLGAFALTACDEGAGTTTGQTASATSEPKRAGQLCALSVAQCQSFAKREAALLPVLSKAPKDRTPIDDATVQLVFNTFASSQDVADKNCTPATGSLKRKVRLVTAAGQTATLMGRGGDVCTLVRGN